MTLKESYDYMLELISNYYFKTHDDEIGDMLGGFDTSIYGKPADPAALGDWIEAVKKVTPNENITEEEARKAILTLLHEYNDHHGFDLIKAIEYFNKSDS